MVWHPSAHGPDVSHWQHVTDEASIPEYELASCKLAEGRSYFDPTSPKWIALFRRKHVRCLGVYFWLRGDSPVEAQFANLVNRLQQVGLADGDDLDRGAFIQFDWETTPNVRNLTVAEVEEFLYLIHVRYGDRGITYGSDWVPGFIEWRRKHPSAPLWYANYSLTDRVTGAEAESKKYGATVLQWTSKYKGHGIASGTPGKPETDTGYDMNHVFDWGMLDRLCLNEPVHAETVTTPPVVVTPPAPIHKGDDEMVIITNREQRDGQPAGDLKFALMDDGRLRPIDKKEWAARTGWVGRVTVDERWGVAWDNGEIDEAGMWTPSAPGSVVACRFPDRLTADIRPVEV